MPDFNAYFTSPLDWNSFITGGRTSGPLDLSAAGIGTPNTSDSSKSAFPSVDPTSLFHMANAAGTAGVPSGDTTMGNGPSLPWLSGVADWFGRAVIIILGFIFVAVGLMMFKNETVTAVAGGIIKNPHVG